MEYRHQNLLYTSSYDRGLDILLFIWSDIKKEIPDAQLFIAYGWDLFDIIAKNNPERQEWKKGVEMLMQQEGIFHLGRVGKEQLNKLREKCGILAYPSYFQEINCLSIIEAAKYGVVPVSTKIAAIPETLNHGVFIDGNIREKEVLEKYKKELISLMKDKKRWERLSYRVKKEALKYDIEKIASKWIDVFEEKIDDIKVSIITPTIREGFWESMSKNLSQQSYKNFEWIIIDDYKDDRGKIALKYAKNYNLDIKYRRGDKAIGGYKRRLGLVRANNLAWKMATGELLIWLQDFVYLEKDGVEALVDLYRHNKRSLLAPVDIYYEMNYCNLKNKEDWFDGKDDFIGKKVWKNKRVKYLGIRETNNHFDFELNFGAIPKAIIGELGGFWEFFDDGLGYDNAEIAYRALKKGYQIIIDDSIIAKCLNLWQIIKGSDQNISGRDRLLNPPRFLWFVKKTDEGRLPLIRDEKIDEKIKLDFKVPDNIPDDEAGRWIEKNSEDLVKLWEKEVIL